MRGRECTKSRVSLGLPGLRLLDALPQWIRRDPPVGKYTGARNALAHDHPEIDGRKGSKSERQVILVHGKGFFQSDKVKARYSQQALTMDAIQEITGNFRELSKIIFDLWGQLSVSDKPSLDKYRKRVSALPENRRLRAKM